MSRIYETNSPEETFELGKSFGEKALKGEIFTLNGDLGTGKTVFTQGFAKGLGINEPVSSPTFTIIREYQDGRIPLYHMDVYRLEEGGGDDLGLEEYFNGDGVNVVEWSKFVADELPDDYLRIIFRRDDSEGDNVRTLTFEATGHRFEQLIDDIFSE